MHIFINFRHHRVSEFLSENLEGTCLLKKKVLTKADAMHLVLI